MTPQETALLPPLRRPTERPHPNVAEHRQAELRWCTHNYWLDAHGWVHGPNVQHAYVPEAGTQPDIWPVSGIIHSNAGPRLTRAESLVAYWRRNDINGEAHFVPAGVNDVGLQPGQLVQSLPVTVRADCNYKANRFPAFGRMCGAVSFECQDNGAAALPTTPLSLAQVGPIQSVLALLCIHFGMSCTIPTRWDDTGIGHHILYKEWSSFTGKTCPGAARIRQMDGIRQGVATQLAAFADATGWHCGQPGLPA